MTVPPDVRLKEPMRVGRLVLWLFLMILLLTLWSIVQNVLFVLTYTYDGPSMEPTLLHLDRVVVDQTAYGLWIPGSNDGPVWAEPERGDVVVANSPADGVDIIKRVIAVGGDTIELRGGQMLLNGTPIPRRLIGPCEEARQKEPNPQCRLFEETLDDVTYQVAYEEGWAELDRAPIQIPPGHVYIRGDHRDHSNDSTNPLIGAVPVSRLRGRVVFTYWSGQ